MNNGWKSFVGICSERSAFSTLLLLKGLQSSHLVSTFIKKEDSFKMPRTNYLLDLPLVLASEVVVAWLDMKSVVRLESAFCSEAMRNLLAQASFPPTLELYNRGPFGLDDDEEWLEEVMAWIKSRKVHVTSVRLMTLLAGRRMSLWVSAEFSVE